MYKNEADYYDFLTGDLRRQFNIITTEVVSNNGYDTYRIDTLQDRYYKRA